MISGVTLYLFIFRKADSLGIERWCIQISYAYFRSAVNSCIYSYILAVEIVCLILE